MLRPFRKQHLLILLTVILAFNYLDRWALGIVLQDIKADLELTDTQLGLLTGIAFALFYATMGIPIARWADRGNRITIIGLTTALWSGCVALSAAATNFVQLLLIRVGVAVGEAGCIPPAHSLIAEHFSREERPRAVARYMLAVPLSLLVGYFAAGWLNEFYGWRVTFVLVGLPGVLLAALAALTLSEPRCSKPAVPTNAAIDGNGSRWAERHPSFKEVTSTLWSISAFRHLLICFSVWYFFGYGLQQWQAAFFIRSHGLSTGELGTWLAMIYGGGGLVGVYLGGEWAARYAAGNEQLQLRACAAAFCIYALLMVLTFLAPDHYLAFAAMALANLGGNVAQGPLLATMQTLVPAKMRAMSIALVYMFANLVGMGLGPLAAGALSDALEPVWAEESLRYALVVLCPGYCWAAWHLWRAGESVARDLICVHREESQAAGKINCGREDHLAAVK
ncbi:MFS transporter [Steroidobacter sp. S1-65]|uniref:MFS transporter n=1 Tax=Steroidobacter gossypii TaxID=2805490 RepID=A0ABS1X6P9_9GAMM|nr:MFS transporter [Steroidobacter gossypii]MBM0108901.1 MFS transporter [Steroidobacter gossypii]